MQMFWYTKFLNPDLDLNDIHIDRERTYYSIEELHNQIISSINFHLSLDKDQEDINDDY